MRRKPESIYPTPEKGVSNIFSLKYVFPTVSFFFSIRNYIFYFEL
jgi:hypothetical protein